MIKSTDSRNEYLFVLGRDAELSILEIKSYLNAREIGFSVKEHFENLLILQMRKIDFSRMVNDLGGVLKIAEAFDGKLDLSKGKIKYGINWYEGELNEGELKNIFKSERIKALRKFSGSKEIMPTDSLKLDLELIVFKKVYKVIAVYNPKKYKMRDETRAHFDALQVISLRLAKILINLSGVVSGTLVDPFCGLGTILQEACLMKIKCVGIEKNRETFEKCKENLKSYNGWKVLHGDSCDIDRLVGKADGVATEPYMGPFLKKIPKYELVVETVSELRKIYSNFLEALARVLVGKAVVIVPLFKTDRGKVDVGFDAMLKKNEFVVVEGFPYRYAPRGCKLERLIYVFEKNKKA